MAPDNIQGGEPDARFDVYALGILLWEMLAGYHPFHDAGRDVNELIRRQAFVELGPLSLLLHLPEYLDVLIRRATAKDPNARFFSMAELAKEMARVRDQLQEDAAAQRIVLRRAPPGEPTLRNPLAHRENRSARVPESEPGPRMPAERVVLEIRGAPPSLEATMPLPSSVAGAVTTPVGASANPDSVAPPVRRASAFIVALALLASVILVVVVLRAVGVHREPPVVTAPRPLPMLTATALPVPVPDPVPVPEPVPVPAPTVAKPALPRPKPATPLPSAAPTSKFKPLFGE